MSVGFLYECITPSYIVLCIMVQAAAQSPFFVQIDGDDWMRSGEYGALSELETASIGGLT